MYICSYIFRYIQVELEKKNDTEEDDSQPAAGPDLAFAARILKLARNWINFQRG